MATPPVPPRPLDLYDAPRRQDSDPPPIPPLPAGFTVTPAFPVPAAAAAFDPAYASPPHFDDPLVAPRPHKLQPDLPANVRPFISLTL